MAWNTTLVGATIQMGRLIHQITNETVIMPNHYFSGGPVTYTV
jgi:hypothetical protein